MRRFIVSMALAVSVPLLALGQVTDVGERNKGAIRRHLERLNRGDVKAAVLDFAEDTKNFGRPVGREGIQRVLEDIYTTFPDWADGNR